MFIVAKSFTNKRGEMFLKIFPNQYPSIETAHAAMQTDYQEELKKRHLDRSDEETIPSSYYIDPEEDKRNGEADSLTGYYYVKI